MGVDRSDDDEPRLDSVDTHEACVPDTTGATDGPTLAPTWWTGGRAGGAADQPDRREAHVDLRAQADDAYRSHAIDQGCDRVREIEEAVVTPAMRRIEAEDPNAGPVGLGVPVQGPRTA